MKDAHLGRDLVPLAEIRVGRRFRKELGDIDSLARSIAEVGLLHPIVVTPTHVLIAGRRRLEACRRLDWKQVPVHVVPLRDIAYGEFVENVSREDFLPSEMVAIQRALAPAERAAARARQDAGRRRGTEPPRAGKFPEREKGRARDRVAAYLGVSGRTLERAAAVVAAADRAPAQYGDLLKEMDQTRRVAGVFKKLTVRQSAEQLRQAPPPPPDGPFHVLVVDPPWDYGRSGDASHRAANPYPSMNLDRIKAEPIPQRAAADSIVWLWTTNGFLRQAFDVLNAWGFTYRTMLTWVKDTMGTGDWLRGQTEHCLMATRGKPVVTLTNETTALHGAARGHSRKPSEFYALVERLCPCPENGRVDWFSRAARPGWVSHGSETQRFRSVPSQASEPAAAVALAEASA
jgi:N6-adenosine-specific RNA methylase IME4/ParB-like chromosome segregation protein Spo0J